ncbi:hypothetical protein [Desulfosporosinus sp.]|uniref:hypothetical protein n=1 Tax=Desulfosporosinus sp. TaxID=157907 RepID=UPI002624CABB|nr:hypothetical protein [Desulfosporosinus sp.]
MAKSVTSIMAWVLIILGLIFLLAALGAPSDARIGGLFISGIFIAAGIYFKKKKAIAKEQKPVSDQGQQHSPKTDSKAAFKQIEKREKVYKDVGYKGGFPCFN